MTAAGPRSAEPGRPVGARSDRSASEAGPRPGPEARPPAPDDPTEALPTPAGNGGPVIVRLFGSSSFFRLWLGMLASSLGDWLGFLAIADLARRVGGDTSGALAVGFVFMARVLPGLLFGAVVGVIVDRFDRKRVMIVCDVGRALVLVALPFVDSVLGLILASLVLELFTLAWAPAKEASVPNLVPQTYLGTANSLSVMAAYGTFPVAAALFAVLAKFGESLSGGWFAEALRLDVGSTLAFYVDAATFLVSAAVIGSLALPTVRRRDVERRADSGAPSRDRTGLALAWTDLKEGWSFIASNPVVRAVNIGLATGLIGGGMLVPLGSIFIDRVLGAGTAGYGLFLTVLGVGVAGGVVTLSVIQQRLPKPKVFTAAVLLAGVCLFGAASVTSLTPAALLIFGLGVCAGTAYVLGFTLLHENVDDALRGRIFSALNTLVRLCLVMSFAIGPFLTQAFDRLSARLFTDSKIELFGLRIFVPGIRVTLWLAGTIMIIAGLLAARSLGFRRPRIAGTATGGLLSDDHAAAAAHNGALHGSGAPADDRERGRDHDRARDSDRDRERPQARDRDRGRR